MTFAYSYINEIVDIIDTSDKKLTDERKEIENMLMSQIANFKQDIEETKKQVHDYKDNNNAKKVDSYRANIVEIKEKLANMSKEM